MGSTKLRRICALAQTHTIHYEIAPSSSRSYIVYITEIDGEKFSRSGPSARLANNTLAYLWYTEQPKITAEIRARADEEIKEFMEGLKQC